MGYYKKNNGLDKFFGFYFDNEKFDKLWNICKLTFAVERGFSVNKEILVENLQQKSLISQRMVYDYMTVKHASSLFEYTIANSLILRCKSLHAKYAQFLEKQKKASENAEKSKKRSLILDKISAVKKKKLNVEKCIVSLKSTIEKYSLKSEEKQDLTLLSKANSFRKAVKEKQDVLETVSQTINKLHKEL